MSLKDQLKKDVIVALKAGDQLKRSVLGMVMTSVKNKELNKRGALSKTIADPVELEKAMQLNDEEIIETISSEIKKRKDSFQQFADAGRQDLADKEQLEINILSAYMPEQMSEAEIKAEVEKTISETGATAKDMGKVIGAVMAKIKGKADGTIVSNLVKELLK